MGGIVTVITAWLRMPLFRDGGAGWLETQSNKSRLLKWYYLFRGWIQMLWMVPGYDIIHFHSTPGHCLISHLPILLYARLWKKKTIAHIHVGNQLKLYEHSRLFRFFLQKSDVVVTLAKVWEPMMMACGVPQERITTIYNPSPEPVPPSTREPYILFFALMNKNKGYDLLIRAFASLAPEFPDWRLEMAGTGETEQAKQLAAELGAAEQIHVHGWVTGAAKDELLRHASGYCMASYMEGFPMAVLESYAYGIPVVTTPVGGLVDVLEDGKNALVFDFGDVKGLTAQLRRLMEDEPLRKQLSAASSDLAQRLFSPTMVEASLKQLYDTLIPD